MCKAKIHKASAYLYCYCSSEDVLKVDCSLSDGAAFKAGVQQGDRIIKVGSDFSLNMTTSFFFIYSIAAREKL